MWRGRAIVVVLLSLLLAGCSSVDYSPPPDTPTSAPVIIPTPTITGSIQLCWNGYPGPDGKYILSHPTTTFSPTDHFFAVITFIGTSTAESVSFSITTPSGDTLFTWQQWMSTHYDGTPDVNGQIGTFPIKYAGDFHDDTLGAVLPSGTPAGTYLLTVNLQDAQITPAQFTYTG